MQGRPAAMKQMMRWVGGALALGAALLALGTLIPRPILPQARSDRPPMHQIVLLSNPIHTDIAIPVNDEVLRIFAPLLRAGVRADLAGARYLVFGWGSRAFYIETPTWSDLKVAPLLTALTVDISVMHVDVSGELDLAQSFAHPYAIDEYAFGRLVEFIARSFRQGPGGPIRISGAAYGDFDAFFEANGYFTALLGCNTWTARALRVAGLKTGWWNPLPQSLALSLALHN